MEIELIKKISPKFLYHKITTKRIFFIMIEKNSHHTKQVKIENYYEKKNFIFYKRKHTLSERINNIFPILVSGSLELSKSVCPSNRNKLYYI